MRAFYHNHGQTQELFLQARFVPSVGMERAYATGVPNFPVDKANRFCYNRAGAAVTVGTGLAYARVMPSDVPHGTFYVEQKKVLTCASDFAIL